MTIADPEWFTAKSEPIINIGVFVELYNWKNYGKMHEIYGIVELQR